VSLAFLETALRRALGDETVRVRAASAVGGGCIHETARLRTTAGEFFAKWNAACPPDLFLREALGLESLRAAGSEIVIPAVVAASAPAGSDPAFLVLEYLPPGAGRPEDERLGRGLATIHRRSAERFGFPAPSYCGATRQDNRACGTWLEFYRDRRLAALVDALRLGAADRNLYQRLFDGLPDLLPRESPPALIHGDLWSGNVLATGRGPALVDPACAFADREMEFGIATLFGGLSARAMAAYEEAWPLPAGWRERNPLYQLYHLLNHALLFGGHYAAEARRIAVRFAG
jgi:protein-ribulosamine 3-kinase